MLYENVLISSNLGLSELYVWCKEVGIKEDVSHVFYIDMTYEY